MDTNRQHWNRVHQQLQRAITANDYQKVIELFLDQHAMVHSAKLVLRSPSVLLGSEVEGMVKTRLWSFEDEVLRGMSEDQIRCIPPKTEHSVAWILFHIARIEDITMNILVAGTPQLFLQDNWAEKLNVNTLHSANSMDGNSIAVLSARVDIDALRAYRQFVGRRTREIVKKLKPEELKQKANPSRLQKVMDEGALLPEAVGILNYWRKRTIAGLLLMPPTRHNFLHLNEALRIKQRKYTGKQVYK
jgi:hypothetical protein